MKKKKKNQPETSSSRQPSLKEKVQQEGEKKRVHLSHLDLPNKSGPTKQGTVPENTPNLKG